MVHGEWIDDGSLPKVGECVLVAYRKATQKGEIAYTTGWYGVRRWMLQSKRAGNVLAWAKIEPYMGG